MTIIHANDPTTRFLSLLYNQREDIKARITEKSTNMDVIRAIRGDDTIMMLGHGNEAGLCTILDENLDFERLIVNSGHVQFLRGKTCIGIWCKADKFAKDYKLHGLFSGMIISELYEASKEHVATTKEEIDINQPLEERAIGGLGIHLIRRYMDSISYERRDDRNILTLMKNIIDT